MTYWKWTCEACGETGRLTDDELFGTPFRNAATRHTASHSRGAFDEVPKAFLEEVTV